VAQAPAPEATPAPAPTVQPALPDPNAGVAIVFGNNASWDVHNNNGQASEFWAYTTDFDNQELAREVKYGLVQNGDHFADTFGHGCVQLDITQEKTVAGGRGGHPIAAAYYDQNGKKVSRINDEIRKACTPQCVPTYTTRTSTSYGPWSEVEGECGTRSKTVTTYTLNSCTQQETSSQAVTTETQECECEEGNPAGLKDYSSAIWSGVVEQGACVYGPPQLTPSIDTVAGCHENGTQGWSIDYTCEEDDEGVINVCRSAECPPPPLCYYKVSGFGGEIGHAIKCGLFGGTWLNFDDSNVLDNHCRFPLPGISNDGFQLTPGQSHPACLNKND
jgi:hypothetical protein